MRLPLDIISYVERDNISVTNFVIDSLSRVMRVRSASTAELKGKFTETEWKFFANTIQSESIDPALSCSTGALIAYCRDAEEFDEAATEWGIDIDDLCSKIETLTGAQVDALYDRVREYQLSRNKIAFSKWAKF